jgi:HD-like signal output (HDOD) protein
LRGDPVDGLKAKVKKTVDDLPPMPMVILKILKPLSDPNSNIGQIA